MYLLWIGGIQMRRHAGGSRLHGPEVEEPRRGEPRGAEIGVPTDAEYLRTTLSHEQPRSTSSKITPGKTGRFCLPPALEKALGTKILRLPVSSRIFLETCCATATV